MTIKEPWEWGGGTGQQTSGKGDVGRKLRTTMTHILAEPGLQFDTKETL